MAMVGNIRAPEGLLAGPVRFAAIPTIPFLIGRKDLPDMKASKTWKEVALLPASNGSRPLRRGGAAVG